MRLPKFIPPCEQRDKPAKERIALAADLLFLQFGLNVSLRQIAHLAGTQTAFVEKYYGSLERMQFEFLQSQLKLLDNQWREVERSHPDDPEAQLRCWIYFNRIQSDESQSPQWQLSRLAAQVANPLRGRLELEIDHYRQTERRKVAKKCSEMKLRDPAELADKIMLLIEGARNERGAYGFPGPLDKLCLAADDLMVTHGAVRKPQYDYDGD